MRLCADTWFLLQFYMEEGQAVHQFRAVELGKDSLVISYITAAETRRKLLHRGETNADLDEFFRLLTATRKCVLVAPTAETAKEAATLAHTFGLSLIDAFVAATTRLEGCDALLTGDEDFRPLVKRKYLHVRSW